MRRRAELQRLVGRNDSPAAEAPFMVMSGVPRRVLDLWGRWGGRMLLSIADQGLVSGSTLVINILLARWLTPSGYGAFAIAFSVFLFFAAFHNALVLEPMSVLGPARYGQLPAEYLGNLLWTHAGVSVGLSAIVAAVSLAFGRAEMPVAGPLLGLALGSPAILSFWLLRRICYLRTRPDLALAGSLTYGLVLAAGLAVSRWRSWVSPFSGFLILGLSSAGACLLLWRALKLGKMKPYQARVKLAIPAFLSEHWHYAKWVLGSASAFWLGGFVYAPLVASFAGLEAAAVFQAMQNLLKPLQRGVTAFDLLFLPWVSRQRALQGEVKANRIMLKVLVAIIAIACAYSVSLLLARQWFVKTLYGQGYYSGFLWLLPYLCLASIIGSLLQGLTIWLKAFNRPNASFWSQIAGAAMTLSVGLFLVWKFKLLGAAVSLIVVNFSISLVLFYFLRRNLRATDESN